MRVDKNKAVKLRLDGKSYPQIAKELECSVQWCKLNLSDVKQEQADRELIEEIRIKGESKDGITIYELRALVKRDYLELDYRAITKKVDKIRKSLRNKYPEFLIRPAWMLSECPQDCTNTLMDMANDIYELTRDNATKYAKLYDMCADDVDSIIYELSVLSSPASNKRLPQGLMTRGRELEAIIERLDERNNE